MNNKDYKTKEYWIELGIRILAILFVLMLSTVILFFTSWLGCHK